MLPRVGRRGRPALQEKAPALRRPPLQRRRGTACRAPTLLAGRIVGGVAFPLDGGVGVFQQSFEEFCEDAFAVRTVGHNHDSSFCVVETYGVVPPAVVMAFLKEGFPVRRPIQTPREPVT